MSRIRSSDTLLEIKVRKYLYSMGFRYRIHLNIRGKPDIAFPGKKIAVFINGCFWHGHGCHLSVIPKTRSDFWKDKLLINVKRDESVNRELTELGWNIIKIWECRIETDFDTTMSELTGLLDNMQTKRTPREVILNKYENQDAVPAKNNDALMTDTRS